MKNKYQGRGLTNVGSRALLAASVALGAAAMGCAASAESDASGEPVAAASEAIYCAGDPTNGNCPWRVPWGRLTPQNAANDIAHSWAPALLSGNTGWLVFSVDTSNHYRMIQMRSSGPTSRSPSWGTYGSTRTWKSKPALAHKEDSSTGLPGFVVAGKLSDNKIMTSSGIMAPSASTLGTPVPDRGFEAVDGTAYTSTMGGLPAIYNFVTSQVNHLVLTYMGDDARTVYAHTRPLPYNGPVATAKWSTRITGPTLPTGWSVIYAPTITQEYAPGMLSIVIHARKGSTDAFFVTHLYDAGTAVFSNEIGSPGKVWYQVANVGAMNDDPTLSWSPHDGLTLYYLRGSQIVQTGFLPNTAHPPQSVAGNPYNGVNAPTFTSSPTVSADSFYDQGTHVVAARAGTQLYWIESNQDTNLEPGTNE